MSAFSPAPLPPPGGGYFDGQGKWVSSSGAPAPLPPPGAPAALPPPGSTANTGYSPPPRDGSARPDGSGWTPDPTSSPAPLPPPEWNPPPALPPPTDTPDHSSSFSSGVLSGPGAYENWIKEHAGQFESPWRVEDLYDGGAANPLSTSRSSGLGDLGPGALDATYAQHGGDFNDPGAREKWYETYGGDPMQKGYTEQLYESGMDHLNPYFDNASKRAIASAQRASAGRGGFNSGLAAQQESDILANLGGQQALEQDRLATAADQERRARYAQGEGFAGDANTDYTNRTKDIFGLAGAKDAADLQREQENRARASQADQEERARINDTFGLAGAADTERANRLGTAAGLEKDLQATGQNRLAGALDATSGLDDKEAGLVKSIYGDFSSVDKVDETWLQAEAEKYGISLEQMRDYASAAGKGIDALTSLFKGGK